DSLRADRLGALGYPRALTPRLDALVEQGLFFERAYAASSFGPQALSALWTGRLPSEGGSTGTEAVPHPTLVTLPRLFKRAGFRTALATNFAGLRARGFTRGFDELELDSVPGRWSGALGTEKALDLVDGAGGKPLFLVVAFADAGEPHQPPAELRARIDVPVSEESLTLAALRREAGSLPPDFASTPAFQDLVARYDAEVAYVDRCLGELVDGLAARGLLEGTLLVVTASHGEEFLEHGYVGSGWTLHEEVLHVPLVVCAPGLDPGRISAPVSVADLFPSLRRMFARKPAEAELDARALFELAGERIVPRPPPTDVLAELVLPELCVLRASIQGHEKLVELIQSAAPNERVALLTSYEERLARIQRGEAQATDPLGLAARRELYDLEHDPHETRDLAATAAARVALLTESLARYIELARTIGLKPAEPQPRADEDEPAALDELRQIGYL
ncbi:MAG: sulfatase, partial [Planctomycetes bacterium]|nr:sulfatase [Planctomycetota bacterium]